MIGRQLLVFRDPVAEQTAERGHRYASQHTFGEADRISPQAVPSSNVLVRDLLP